MDGRTVLDGNDFLWKQNRLLAGENAALRRERDLTGHQMKQSRREVERLGKQVRRLEEKNAALEQRLADLKIKLKLKGKAPPAAAPPSFVKADVSSRRARRPGRKAGHAAALRPMPEKIDVHQQAPLPVDEAGFVSCPDCKTRLSDVTHHEQVVEDIIPSRVIVTCYHTVRGFCPCCRKQVRSRAEDQPPPHDLPHGQLGLNALTTAAVMRVCYRLPMRQVTSLFQQLPGLKISPGAIAKQLQRLGQWLEGEYHRLKLSLRLAGVVHADETGWRTGGKNGYLWTLTGDDRTLYHVDRSRGGKVIAGLLGEAFGSDGSSTLVSDFYGVYDRFDGPQQKCLAHLLRELKETAQRKPELRGHALFKKCRRLVRDMLKLKARREELAPEVYPHRVALVEARLAKLAGRQWEDADAARIGKRLSKYQGKLTTFLHKAEVDGTNNAAERALRPAVVMRKITGGSRSEAGAKAWAILASVMRTAQQQGKDVVETIKTLLKAHWAGKEATLLSELLTPKLAADTS